MHSAKSATEWLSYFETAGTSLPNERTQSLCLYKRTSKQRNEKQRQTTEIYRWRGSGLRNLIVHIARSHAGLCGVKWEVFCSYLVTSSSWESLLILSHYVALGTMTEKECAEKPIKFGDWGRRNGESTRLPPLRPEFES